MGDPSPREQIEIDANAATWFAEVFGRAILAEVSDFTDAELSRLRELVADAFAADLPGRVFDVQTINDMTKIMSRSIRTIIDERP